jgi:hypothetical protein
LRDGCGERAAATVATVATVAAAARPVRLPWHGEPDEDEVEDWRDAAVPLFALEEDGGDVERDDDVG